MLQNVLVFIHLKMFKIAIAKNKKQNNYSNIYSMLFCVTQNNSSLGNTHVDHIL